jgi:uncharacterized membrane protein YeaQ/YmgE (transglycosylase-associated protein family)
VDSHNQPSHSSAKTFVSRQAILRSLRLSAAIVHQSKALFFCSLSLKNPHHIPTDTMIIQKVRSLGLSACIGCFLFFGSPGDAQETTPPVGERITAAADQAKASVQEAGTAAVNKIDQIWRRIDERRLVHRTPDELVAWAIMGLLVGACAGLFSVLRTGALQRLSALALGLVGAFIGGIVAHVAQLDFGLGPVLIRYEDLLLSLVGGLLLILVVRFLKARRRGKV